MKFRDGPLFFWGKWRVIFWGMKFISPLDCAWSFWWVIVCAWIFLTSKNGTWIVDSTCLIFSPWLSLHNLFSAIFFSIQEFFGNCSTPHPSPLKNNSPFLVTSLRLQPMTILQLLKLLKQLTLVKSGPTTVTALPWSDSPFFNTRNLAGVPKNLKSNQTCLD